MALAKETGNVIYEAMHFIILSFDYYESVIQYVRQMN